MNYLGSFTIGKQISEIRNFSFFSHFPKNYGVPELQALHFLLCLIIYPLVTILSEREIVMNKEVFLHGTHFQEFLS